MVDEYGLEIVEQGAPVPGTKDEYGLEIVGEGAPASQAKPGKGFTPRERLTFTGELMGGLKDLGSGVSSLVTGDIPRFVPNRDKPSVFKRDWTGSKWQDRASALAEELLAPLTGTGAGKTLMGALRTAGSLFARLQNPTAAAGDFVEETTGSKLAGDVTAFGGDLAAALALGRPQALASKWVKESVKAGRPLVTSKRMKAENLGTKLNKTLSDATANEERIVSSTAASIEQVEELAETARRQIPTAQTLRARFAPNAPLGKESGKGYQAGFNQKFEEAKTTFEDLYNPLREEAATLPTDAAGFVTAGGKLKESTGITGSFTTKPEAVAGRTPKIAQSVEDLEAQAQKAISEAAPGDRANVFQRIMEDSKVPAENATVADLINERQRISAAKRVMKDDNSRRQAQELIDGLDADITAASPDLAKRYGAVNERFATEYAPYFSRGSITRAIAQGTPESVVDAIYRPTITKTGRTINNKSIEAMTRSRELIKDPAQWDRINRSFMNQGIEQAFEDGVFKPNRAQKWWNSYKDPTGTGNEVLRKGLGEAAFKDIDSVFTQLSSARVREIDELAAELTKNYQKKGDAFLKSSQQGTKALVGTLEKEIETILGAPLQFTKRVESIGSGVFVSGVMRTNFATMGRGFLLAIGAPTLGNLVSHARGRSLLKALVRSAPGTIEGARAVKGIHALMNAKEGTEED